MSLALITPEVFLNNEIKEATNSHVTNTQNKFDKKTKQIQHYKHTDKVYK